MTSLKRTYAIIALLFAPILAAPAGAGTVFATGDVLQVLVTSDASYGGCMARLSVNPATLLPMCGGYWVTFSCTGEYADPVRAYRMLDQAQLALAAGKSVLVRFTDERMHNGYCLATRIDVIK